jgi:hypothetical protein
MGGRIVMLGLVLDLVRPPQVHDASSGAQTIVAIPKR